MTPGFSRGQKRLAGGAALVPARRPGSGDPPGKTKRPLVSTSGRSVLGNQVVG